MLAGGGPLPIQVKAFIAFLFKKKCIENLPGGAVSSPLLNPPTLVGIYEPNLSLQMFDSLDQCFSTFFSTWNPFDEENFSRNPLGQQKYFAEPQTLLLTGSGAHLIGCIVSFKFRGTPGGCSRNTRVPRNPG